MIRRSRARQTCREYRVIPNADMPSVIDYFKNGNPKVPRAATENDLMQMGIFVIYTGANNTLVEVHGYLDEETRTGVNAVGEPWPGKCLEGRTGMYRRKRLERIAASLLDYKKGDNGGKRFLMDAKLPEESERRSVDPDGAEIVTKAINLPGNKSQRALHRLERRLPRIMGDR